MKKILLLAALVLTSIAAMAKTADELRVYINPGHGSYTPNDRPMAVRGHGPYSRTNTDTTSFFERNTNLRKGFGILENRLPVALRVWPCHEHGLCGFPFGGKTSPGDIVHS